MRMPELLYSTGRRVFGGNMAITLIYAQNMLAKWQDCEMELATGQAKEYTIGTRSFTSFDLKEIRAAVQYWEDKVDVLSGATSGRRVKMVVPRDM